MPRKYRYLLDWYEDDYANRNRGAIGSLPLGGAVADLLRLAGTISKNDLVISERERESAALFCLSSAQLYSQGLFPREFA